MYDVAVLGGGISGMATAARLQAAGLATVVLESHGQPGGCAGFFRRRGFAFDVGATTLVDFSPSGIGGELLTAIGIGNLDVEELAGYVAWLPARRVTLFRDLDCWRSERIKMLGASPACVRLWQILDKLAGVFWNATRRGVKLPAQSPHDVWRITTSISPADWPLVRYLRWTVGDLLRALRLRDNKPLCGLLSMLLEDTVHAGLDEAPLINGSLGITIRGAGLSRARGGMYGFWRQFVARYRELGGVLSLGTPVTAVSRDEGYAVHLRRGIVRAQPVVSALTIELTARRAPAEVGEGLQPYLRRNNAAVGGALVLFLGVPVDEVTGQDFTHDQHHRVFPAPDDPEGDPARMNFWTAVFLGPLFLPRLWLWALRHNHGRVEQQCWLLAEALWAIGFPAAAVVLWPITKGPAVYAALAIVGSWVYPLLTVHLPHHGYGDTPLTQIGTLRGVIIPRLFLELTYHLEHHLYPTVPSHHLAKLSQRLDPTLRAHGVSPRCVP